MVIKLCHADIPAEARRGVLDVLASGQFSPGARVREFERKFAALHGAKHAVFVNSGTDALRLGLLAMKEKYRWSDGDFVAVPTVTFVATVNVVFQAGLRPWFVGVSQNDYLMNFWNLEHRLATAAERPKIRAVMPVHLFGAACDPILFTKARRMGLRVLEDSCETILNPIQGDVSCHSTYMAHHLTTGVGGVAVTNDDHLNLLIRSYANHGRNEAYLPGYRNPGLGRALLARRFRFDRIGYSSRATEFEAVLGLAQMGGLKQRIAKRREVARKLNAALYDFWAALKLPQEKPDSTWMMYPLALKEKSRFRRDALCLHLEKSGIETRPLMPITNQPCYGDFVDEDECSVAQWVNANGFYIPCHEGMTDRDIQHIRRTFRRFFDGRS